MTILLPTSVLALDNLCLAQYLTCNLHSVVKWMNHKEIWPFHCSGKEIQLQILFHSQHRTVTALGLSAWSPPVPCSCGWCLQRLQICNYRSRGDGAAGIWWLARQCVRALPVTPEVWQLRKPWCGLHGNRPVVCWIPSRREH